MTLKIFDKLNHLVKLMILLAAAILLILTIILLVNCFPEAAGSLPPTYQMKKSYSFEPWLFSFKSITLSLPVGGTIVPIYEQEKQVAVLILGRGIYMERNENNPDGDITKMADPDPAENLMTPPGNIESKKPEGIFLMITEEELEEVKKDIIFIPVQEYRARKSIEDIFSRQIGLPMIWQDKIPFTFTPSKSGEYYYFIDEQGDPLLPPVLNQAHRPIYISALLYVLFYISIWLIILILSLDYHSSKHRKEKEGIFPGPWELGAVQLAIAMAFVGEALPTTAHLPVTFLAAGYGAGILLLVLLSKAGKIDNPDLGMRRNNWGRGYFIAIVATIMLLTTILRLPQGINLPGRQTATLFFTTFFFLGLSREIIWRGFILNTLGKHFKPAVGLLVTALLAGAFRAGIYLIATPWMLFYPFTYIEIAVLEPGLAAILGLLYLRSENVFSCALLHTLVIILPQLLVF